MKVPRAFSAATLVATAARTAFAQEPLMYTDEETGIEFATWGQERIGPNGDNPTQAGFTFGIALPSDAMEKDATEYIGLLKCGSTAADARGWCGFSHGQSGQMTQALLLVAYPYEDQVLTSFRFATSYVMPELYEGNAKLTQISSKVTDEGFELIYRCENCFSWDHQGMTGSVSTTNGFIVGGRAQSRETPENAACSDDMAYSFHADGFGQWGASITDAVNEKYEDWAALATKEVRGTCAASAAPVEKPVDNEDAKASPTTVDTPSDTAAPVDERPEREDRPDGENTDENNQRASRPDRPSEVTTMTRLPRPSPTISLTRTQVGVTSKDPVATSPSEEPEQEMPSKTKPMIPTKSRPKKVKPFLPKPSRPFKPYKPHKPIMPHKPLRPYKPHKPSRPMPHSPSRGHESPFAPSRPSRPSRPGSERPSIPEAPERPARPSIPSVAEPDNNSTVEPAKTPEEPKPSTAPGGEGDGDAPIDKTEPETEVKAECTPVSEDETYDYIIVGAGAGGIPMADRLSAAGHKVLLIEKGPPSTDRWGGTMKPEWLEGKPLTRFDVPGLCNQIWHDAEGIVCTDMDQIAGCVLGGGTAVNAGLWWKPHPDDWDYNFPEGWKSTDVVDATARVFQRIPGTTHPSMDGILYQDEGFQVLKGGLENAGWEFMGDSNSDPTKKNHTFAYTTFMFSNGERGGPLATYLVTASRRENFSLWMNTSVRRVIRDGGLITGVELECTGGGRSGTITVPSGGRVIFSAGTFGTAKLLLRSGIGPVDQLQVVQSSDDDAESMINEDSWITLPVGENLMDHLNTDVVVEHPNVYQYNYTEAWWDPNPTDAKMYLEDRSGILAAAAPNIGPMIWDRIPVSDGIDRQLQWTCRMEGSLDFFGNHTITMSQYLGRGVVSRGRMTLTPGLTTMVSTLPYLANDGDREAVIRGLDNIRNALKDVPDLKFLSPADNITSEEYVDNMFVSVARRSNHWMGTAKMGEDDGRSGGTAVIDANNRVYGTENLFVVDASIFPGMMTGNPSAMIVIMSEHAADRILALPTTASAEDVPAKGEEGAQS